MQGLSTFCLALSWTLRYSTEVKKIASDKARLSPKVGTIWSVPKRMAHVVSIFSIAIRTQLSVLSRLEILLRARLLFRSSLRRKSLSTWS